jgi:hypothetical protein
MAKSAVSAKQLEVILSTVLSKTLPEIMAKTLEKFESQIELTDLLRELKRGLTKKLKKFMETCFQPTRGSMRLKQSLSSCRLLVLRSLFSLWPPVLLQLASQGLLS